MNPSNTSAIKSAKPTFELKPSRLHLLGLGIIGALMILAVFSSKWADYGVFILPVIFWYLYDHYRHHLGQARIHTVCEEVDRQWALNGVAGYQLLSASCIRRYWAILYFKNKHNPFWKRTSCVAVFPDSLEKEAFRRLRVIARSSGR